MASRVARPNGKPHQRKRHHGDEHGHDRRQSQERVAFLGHRYMPRYQASSGSPATAATSAPTARKVPNGSANFMSPRPDNNSPMPTNEPAKDARTSVTSISFQPRNAPIIASIFTSPMPSPSMPRSR